MEIKINMHRNLFLERSRRSTSNSKSSSFTVWKEYNIRFAQFLEDRKELAVQKIEWFAATYPRIYYNDDTNKYESQLYLSIFIRASVIVNVIVFFLKK